MSTWPSPRDWITKIRTIDDGVSLWPGPRPLTEADGIDGLVGRKNDLAEFIQNITTSRLTHLIGPSGVGKSSLLMAGIVPKLAERNYTVALCRDWSTTDDVAFDVYLAERLYDNLSRDQQKKLSRNTDIFWELHAMGGAGVVILDQFEELIRQGGERRREVFEFLTQLYLQTDIPVVLSYRSEYKEELGEFDRDMRIDRPRTQRVQPVKPGVGAKLLKQPRRPSSATDDWTRESVISSDAVGLISDYWEAGRRDDEHARVPVGLLHLQALMFVLSHRASSSALIDVADFEAFQIEANKHGFVNNHDVLTYALEASAEVRLELARQAARSSDIAMDEFLVRGITSMLTRIVPHLSSGGFKLERDVLDLATTVLKDELAVVTRWFDQCHDIDESLAEEIQRAAMVTVLRGAATANFDEDSILAGPRTSITAVIDTLVPASFDTDSWSQILAPTDPKDITAGPMMDQSPFAALIEQLRRFGWAVLWLHELNLARLNSDGNQQGTLTLVHDGLGDSLQRWSSRFQKSDQTEALFALIAPEGESYEWFNDAYAEDLCGTADAPKLHVNLRLKGNSIIGARLAHAAFVNCDFRGTFFLQCDFTAVSFLNCRLDGALISDCTVSGHEPATSESEGKRTRVVAPRFVVPASHVAVTSVFAHYTESAGDRLISPQPGLAAHAASTSEGVGSWISPSSGLVIEGSRLSALTVRGTVFRDDAALSFVNVVGSGLELAELAQPKAGATEPRIEFHESLVRHIAFTGKDAKGRVTITATGSVLAQGWVGAGLDGSFRATNSLIGQWWIEPNDFTATLGPDCKVTGLVGFQPLSEGTRLALDDLAIALDEIADDADLANFHSKTALMDYRRD